MQGHTQCKVIHSARTYTVQGHTQCKDIHSARTYRMHGQTQCKDIHSARTYTVKDAWTITDLSPYCASELVSERIIHKTISDFTEKSIMMASQFRFLKSHSTPQQLLLFPQES